MNKIKENLIAILGTIIIMLGGGAALGGLDYSRVETKTVLDAISATTTSDVIDINGADRVTLSLNVSALTGDAGKATSTFAVTVSADGENYVTYNKLVDNVTNSISQNLTRVASVAIDSNTTKIYSMDLQHDVFKFMKITDTITGTTTSEVTAVALINY